MTYDRNPDERRTREREGMSGPLMAGIILALVIALGLLFYALNRDDRTASTTTSPAPTTGQSQKAPTSPPTPAPK